MNEATFDAISRIEVALRDAGLLSFSGEVQLWDWAKSTAKSSPWVKFALLDDDSVDPFEGATVRKGKTAGQLLHLLVISLENPVYVAQGEQKQVNLASELHIKRYWHNTKLWLAMHDEKIYTAQKHKLWVQAQPCALAERGKTHFQACAGDVIAHHCNAANAIAGGKRQPENPQKELHFWCVPLCHIHHTWIHNQALRANKEALALQAVEMTAERMREAMKHHMGMQSMRDIDQEALDLFEEEIGL